MFPFEVSIIEESVLITKGCNEVKLWHLHYDHLNINEVVKPQGNGFWAT